MKILIDPGREWKQIFNESWRQMRDFFYAKNMHGCHWEGIHEKYAALLPYVAHRNDLTYIIGEMIGELNVSHAYVNGGDRPAIKKVHTGLLGARLEKSASGYFIITKILPGHQWNSALVSPLLHPVQVAKVGDYLLSINGTDLKNITDPYSLLANKNNTLVELVINDKPVYQGSKTAIVKTISDESDLYYHGWVQHNIQMVDSATNGTVGYLHVPDMTQNGLNQFAEHFYAQLDKKAIIIDNRGNGGGNVSPMIVERLRREVIRMAARRGASEPYPVPFSAYNGKFIMLVDKYSASDGDLFAYAFKKFGIGQVIGTRTWGGVVGIAGSLPFIDGSDLRKPEVAAFSAETGKWIIEGHGVEPDIWVDNNPHEAFKGIDDQLIKAIEAAFKEAENGKDWPPLPKEKNLKQD
ncbi:MAG: hypothetical protein HC896_05785 [Bacteroidales bacterium]|nr:hypothetical protein [Bacteroidales bacterium]